MRKPACRQMVKAMRAMVFMVVSLPFPYAPLLPLFQI